MIEDGLIYANSLIGKKMSSIDLAEKYLINLNQGNNTRIKEIKNIFSKKNIIYNFERSSFKIIRQSLPGALIIFRCKSDNPEEHGIKFGILLKDEGLLVKCIGIKNGIVSLKDMISKYSFIRKEKLGTIIEGYIVN